MKQSLILIACCNSRNHLHSNEDWHLDVRVNEEKKYVVSKNPSENEDPIWTTHMLTLTKRKEYGDRTDYR